MDSQLLLDQESVARSALNTSPIFCLREIDVSHDGESILLSGRVPSFYYKQLAQEAVRAVVEHVQVVNDVNVD